VRVEGQTLMLNINVEHVEHVEHDACMQRVMNWESNNYKYISLNRLSLYVKKQL